MNALFPISLSGLSRLVALTLLLGLPRAAWARVPLVRDRPLVEVTHTEAIDRVWAGQPVGFAFLTYRDTFLVAYYDAEQYLRVAWRPVAGGPWRYQRLPEQVGWDSHNSIAIGVDATARLHLAGNMHASPLHYYRTLEPMRPDTFAQVEHLVDPEREQSVTYPAFVKDAEDRLVFLFRDGLSGNGDEYAYVYNPGAEQWSALSGGKPFIAGEGLQSAYPSFGTAVGRDGARFMPYNWRDTSMAETNHDVCAIFTRNYSDWFYSDGTPCELPVTLFTGEVIDSVPVQGGLMPPGYGGACYDQAGRPLVTYTKYDGDGNNQIYAARLEGGLWHSYALTSFRYRWEIGGGGTLPRELTFTRLVPVGRNHLVLFFWHRVIAPFWQAMAFRTEDLRTVAPRRRMFPSSLDVATTPGLQVNLSSRYIPLRKGAGAYLLRWETLPANRDQPPPDGEAPPPQVLSLVEVTAAGGWPPGVHF